MKHHVKKVLATIVLGLGIFAGGALVNPSYAYYADSSSAVYLGSDSNSNRYYAINVVDDDGTVYTFQYRFRGYEEIYYRVDGESTWHDWPMGIGIQYSHIEKLSLAGFQELKKRQ